MGTLYMTSNVRDSMALTLADSELWRYRLDYVSEKRIKILLKKGKLIGLKFFDVSLYENCILEK